MSSTKKSHKNSRQQLNAWIRKRKNDPPVACRYSEHAFARDVGVTSQGFRKWRTGESTPSPKHARKLERLTDGAVRADGWSTK